LDDVLDDIEAGRTDISIGDGFYPEYIRQVQRIFRKNLASPAEAEFKKVVDGMYTWKCRSENVELGSFSLYGVSLKNYGVFVESPGAEMELLNGYRTVLDAIIRPFSADFYSRLNLNSPLLKILLAPQLASAPCEQCKYTTDRSKVVLLFSDKIVICDNVLLTMSNGYLKANLPTLVEPASYLTSDKLQALQRLGFGAVNKVSFLL
jgi:hypothetical protein